MLAILLADGRGHLTYPRTRDVTRSSPRRSEVDVLEVSHPIQCERMRPISSASLLCRDERLVHQVVRKHAGSTRSDSGDGGPELGLHVPAIPLAKCVVPGGDIGGAERAEAGQIEVHAD